MRKYTSTDEFRLKCFSGNQDSRKPPITGWDYFRMRTRALFVKPVVRLNGFCARPRLLAQSLESRSRQPVKSSVLSVFDAPLTTLINPELLIPSGLGRVLINRVSFPT